MQETQPAFQRFFKKFSIVQHACPYFLHHQLASSMRLDATDLRYVTPDEFRVLTAVHLFVLLTGKLSELISQVEIGSKNHEVVPTTLIAEISAIRGGNVNKALGALAKRDLVARVQNARCMLSSSPPLL